MKFTAYSPEHATSSLGALSGLLITGFPESAYHARPEVSTHDAGKIAKAPAHYHYAKTHPEEPTAAMQAGTALHIAVLERDRWEDLVAVPPEDAPRKPTSAQREAAKPSPATVEAVAWWDRFNAESEGKLILTRSIASEIWERAAAIRIDHDAANLLADGIATEVSVFWRDAETNVPRRGRMDRLREGNMIVDLKSTACAAASAFSRDAVTYGYFRQAADYVDALELLTGEPWTFWWIAAESEPPWLSCVYQCPPEGIDLGRIGRRAALDAWADGKTTDIWPGYQSRPSQLLPPVWSLKEAGL